MALAQRLAELAQTKSNGEPLQLQYIAHYAFRDLRARRLVIEAKYIDRHYMEEFAGHYARDLCPPMNQTTRVHFFRGDSCPLEWIAKELEGDTFDLSDVESLLNERYLGFCVLRPIPEVPVGRTILRHVGSRNGGQGELWECARNFEPANHEYRIHFAGLRLKVSGLPFQQQDRAVGACATTALWSALAAVAKMNGFRAPTPMEVSTAAFKGQVIADKGLTLEQMSTAVHAFGFRPRVFNCGDDSMLAQAEILTWLRAGIPVIARLSAKGESHAATLCGFRLGDQDKDWRNAIREVSFEGKDSRSIPVAFPVRYYLHDDNVGPYQRRVWVTHAESLDADEQSTITLPILQARTETQEQLYSAGIESDYEIVHAIVPVYAKNRLQPFALLAHGAELWQLYQRGLRNLADRSLEDRSFHVETRFVRSGDYLRELLASGVLRAVDHQWLQSIRLSRYVGLVRLCDGDQMCVDWICDATTSHEERSLIACCVFSPDPGGVIERHCGDASVAYHAL